MKLKARELRKKQNHELITMMSEIDKELMKFKAAQAIPNATIKLPMKNNNVSWGIHGKLKRDKAIILTVLTERGIRR